ncbi:DUF998 domain-containing protein [Nocardia stercoris]|uniref:DUF998 domain-containing protein n=1 Tax=Nocardia stercoris TaxID=2483361 RepID=UPI001F2E4D23|nr:DUF998 domain-containing protein [Nocardia stercoris]
MLTGTAGVTYSSWVLEFFLPGGPNPVTSFLSELAEPDRQFAWVYSVGDTVTGVLAVVAGIVGLLVFRRRRLTVVGWGGLVAFGAATMADARLPLHRCRPDPCPHVDYGLFPQLHQIHALTSTLAVISIFLVMIVGTAAGIRYGRREPRRDAGLWILVLASVVTVWMLVADNLPGDYVLGVAQRIQVAGMSVWLVLAGVRICRAERLVAGAKTGTTGMVGT